MLYVFLCHAFLFIYCGFYVTFNTVQVISRRVIGRAEETSTYSSSGFCTVNCRPAASNYQLSHLRPCWEWNPGLRGGRQECYHSATVAPFYPGALKVVRAGGWVGGRWEKVCPVYISETVRCRKLILGTDIG